MKRILLTLVCCSPLLLSTPIVQSVELIGPSSEQPILETYGPTSSTETLWSISNKLRPNNSVSVYQTLVAIYKLNPYAFRDGDVNKLVPNSVLNVPDIEFIAKQTNQEAYRLLKPKNKVRKPVVKKTVPTKPTPVVKKTVTPAIPTVVGVDPNVVEQLKSDLADRDTALATAESQVAEQEKELLLLNEQILSVTEANQALKIKLQPLLDQIEQLNQQVESDLQIQQELKDLIDQYKQQIDAFVEPPFSGEGWLNELLRTITSSITSLLLTILTPLLVLTALFVLFLRIKSKRELALQEQEMAESTAIHMEETGKFDSLLTDDLHEDEAETDEIDFTQQASMESELDTPVQAEPAPVQPEPQQEEQVVDDIGEVELDIVEESDEVVNLDELAVPEKEEFEELVASEDDPFGIEALVDEENLLIDEDEGGEPDALISESEESVELSASDLENTSDADQADLDLAAEWEAQLASNEEQEVVDLEDVAAESTSEAADEVKKPEALDVVDELAESEPEPKQAIDEIDLEALTSESQAPETDLEELDNSLEQEVATQQTDISDLDELLEQSEQLESEKEVEELDVEDLSEFENVDLSTLKSVDDSLSELDAELESQTQAEALQEDEQELQDDLLAQQLSAKAFNEDVPLPSVESSDKEEFIDIETLLEDTDVKEYEEEAFDLEMGLEEFPDVVHADNEYENDESGTATQLDLARAYLEIDEKQGAKEILTSLLETANPEQLAEVKKLLARID